MKKWLFFMIFFIAASIPLAVFSLPDDGLGQTIQIQTQLRSYVGNPTWMLLIRDIDHNQNIPYLFDIQSGENSWIALTYGQNYLILASRLQFPTYQSRYNEFKSYRINNFCNLESYGRIIRRRSLQILVSGDLQPNSRAYHCQIFSFPQTDLVVANHH